MTSRKIFYTDVENCDRPTDRRTDRRTDKARYRSSGPELKNDPKIKSKSKVRIEGTIENKSYSTTFITAFEPLLSPKRIHYSLKQPSP